LYGPDKVSVVEGLRLLPMVYDRVLVSREQPDVCISRLPEEVADAYESLGNLAPVVLLRGARRFANADLWA
jgi:hypothetical protein